MTNSKYLKINPTNYFNTGTLHNTTSADVIYSMSTYLGQDFELIFTKGIYQLDQYILIPSNCTRIVFEDGTIIKSTLTSDVVFEKTGTTKLFIENLETLDIKNPLRIQNSPELRMNDCRFLNTTIMVGAIGPTFFQSSNISVKDVKLKNFGQIGLNFQAAGVGNQNVLIDNCEIDGIGDGISTMAYGINMNSVNSYSINNCRVSNTKNSGIYSFTSSGKVLISKNVVHGSPMCIDVDNSNDSITVSDNFVYDFTEFGIGVADTSNVKVLSNHSKNTNTSVPLVRNCIRLNWSASPKTLSNNVMAFNTLEDVVGNTTEGIFINQIAGFDNIIESNSFVNITNKITATEKNIVRNNIGLNPDYHVRLGGVSSDITIDRETGKTYDFGVSANINITLVNGKWTGDELNLRLVSGSTYTVTFVGNFNIYVVRSKW